MDENDRNFDPSEIPQWFWDIIHQAGKSRDNLKNMLLTMEKEALIRFEDEFLEAAAQLNDEPFLKYIDPDESEDGVEDIVNWVVSQGKYYYTQVWNNPSLIAKCVGDPGNLHGVAGEVFWERFGEEIQDWLMSRSEMRDQKVDLNRLPAWQRYLIGTIVVVIVVAAAWTTGKDKPIPPWITNCLIPGLAVLGLVLIILAVVSWIREKR